MELRWLKGNWEYGKYKLQYRIPWDGKNDGSGTPWFDVQVQDSDSCNHPGTCQESEENRVNASDEEIKAVYNSGKGAKLGEPGFMESEKIEKWCEHCKPGSVWELEKQGFVNFSVWKYCPICGTPRPVEKPLRERLAIVLFNAWWSSRPGSEVVSFEAQKEVFLREADAAIEFLEKNK